MYALPVPLDFPVEDCVFVLGQHLLFRRHLLLPRFHLLQGLAQAREGGVKGGDDVVNASETVAVPVLLVGGQAPWDFPRAKSACWIGGGETGGWRTREDRPTAGS